MQKKKEKTIILNSVGIVLTISLGIGIGFVLSNFFPHVVKEINYNSWDPEYLKADSDACLSKFNKIKASANPFDGKSMQGWELANAALRKFEKEERNMSQGIGAASAKVGPMSVDQQIRSTMYRVGDSYFEESLSKSFAVNVAWRMYENEGTTLRYKGSCPSNVEIPSFSSDSDPLTFSDSEYLAYAGRNLNGSSTIYIISDKTLASKDQASLSGLPFNGIVVNDDGTYTINIELDARKSVVNYVKQMMVTTEMNSAPVFDYVHMSFVVTSDCELVTSTSTEKYFASTPSGSSNIEGTLKTVYSTGGNYEIPDLSTPITYSHN